MLSYRIELTYEAKKMLLNISERSTVKKIEKVIDRLEYEPEKQGKALIGNLSGFRSIRAAGQRYRIIYKVENEIVRVYILALGIRKEGHSKDIYNLTRKLLRLNLLNTPDSVKISDKVIEECRKNIKDYKKLQILSYLKDKFFAEEDLKRLLECSGFKTTEITLVFKYIE